MAKQNKKVMSIAIEPDLQERIKEYAKRKGYSASSYVSDLVVKALKIDIDEEPIVVGKPVDEEILTVVLKIPANLKEDEINLTNWLDTKCRDLVKKITNSKADDAQILK